MEIERAFAKIRARGVVDDVEDHERSIYADRLLVRTVLGAPEPCPRLVPGVSRPETLAPYQAGRPLEAALREAYARAYAAADA